MRKHFAAVLDGVIFESGKKKLRRRPRFADTAELGYFTFCFQSTAKKCTKIYNARAGLLFCSLNLLFAG